MSNYSTIQDLRDAYASKRISKRDAEAYARAHANALIDPANNPDVSTYQVAMAWMQLDLSDIKPAERKPDPTISDYAELMAVRAGMLRRVADQIQSGMIYPENLPEAMLDGWAEAVSAAMSSYTFDPDNVTSTEQFSFDKLATFATRKLQGGHLARIPARNADKGRKNDLDQHLNELAEQDDLEPGAEYWTDDLHRATSQYTEEEVNHEERSMRLPRWSSVSARGKTGNLTGWVVAGLNGTRAGKPCVTDQRLVYIGDDADHDLVSFDSIEELEGWKAEQFS